MLLMMVRWWRGRRAKDAVATFETMSIGSVRRCEYLEYLE
jgi:hypothetical protein